MNYAKALLKNNGAWGEQKGYKVLKPIAWCERCGVLDNLTIHHIIYRSEAPHHPQLHNPLNLYKVCVKCHSWFHAVKGRRTTLVNERKLWEIFPEHHLDTRYALPNSN